MAKGVKNKIVVIGAGNVGENIAYVLMIRELANEIVLLDIDINRANGSAMDIAHGTAFYEQITVRAGSYEDCADANIIIITAGVGRKPGQTRLELAKTNVNIGRDIARNIVKYNPDPLLIVVSNPVDIITMAIQMETGLDPNRVIGTGTALDTARLRYLIGQECGVSVSDVAAYVLGEHGDSQVALWSRVRLGGITLEGYAQQFNMEVNKELLAEKAKKAGAEIIAEKGATYNGIAMTTGRIVEAIVRNENSIMAVSHMLKGEKYGDWQGIAMSVPCILNENGIARGLFINMNDEEKEGVDRSARIMHEFWNSLDLKF